MERSEEALRERVRETPLSERLKTCEKYVASMCAERRPPKMTIPLQHYDEDFYIYTTLADAEATIAALQAKVSELQGVADEKCRCFLERAEQSEKQLTQRTAERDTARRRVDELEAREVDVVMLRDDLEQRTAELEAAKRERDEAAKDRDDWITSWRALQRYNERIEAELERAKGLVKTYADAKTDFDDKRLQEDHHAWRERYTRLVGAETILIALTATSQPAPPYKEWCRHPDKCAGLASCPQDPTCAD